ncbi:MAG: bifunctional folylpolyglutamate synthase/dihydrofolate synthase [Bacteroidetes bacterium]|nr:bifunctional folylpolyglutamate synthase/dihydrofolate synthase [Bacteroidota bacterium]
MTYRQTLDYLFSRLPMFHRIGAAAYKADLKNTIELCNSLGNPQNSFKSLHIAGTNGKGSTSHLLAAVLQKAGYNTALYTSPHLKDFRERIRINGEMIPEKVVVDFVNEHKTSFEKIDLSFFEWCVGLAFDYFAKEKVDIAIIETGLGGRLDSTNIITPELSIITNISYDHMQLLGDTLEKIATEKAGIIKKFVPVIIGERQIEIQNVFTEHAKKLNSPLTFAEDIIQTEVITNDENGIMFNVFMDKNILYSDLKLNLQGNYQQKNITTVLCAIEHLKKSGWKISESHVRDAFSHVQELTGLMGRWQKLSDAPLVICDVGHNKAGIEFIVQQISQCKFEKLHMVIGVVNDKDVSGILELLPANASYYFCKANIPRALDAEELKNLAKAYNLNGNAYESVSKAISAAKSNSSLSDMIFIGGSTFVVAEAII